MQLNLKWRKRTFLRYLDMKQCFKGFFLELERMHFTKIDFVARISLFRSHFLSQLIK